MYSDISQMEPLYPARLEGLEDLARQLVETSAKLQGSLAPATLLGVNRLLRVVNSYYSNLIEGHDTHPIDVERAMRQDYMNEPAKRDLQIESVIHIEVQEDTFRQLAENPTLNVTAPAFLCSLHEKFYARLPEHLRWAKGDGGQQAFVEAGKLRARYVQVGEHIPPTPESLPAFLDRFAQVYDPSRWHGLRGFVALAAAHHRLMWIHPFLDGNGRVARLFTDAYFMRYQLAGYGLWNVSRGLAREQSNYRNHLAAADAPREGDLDGRGNLSNRTLTEFCRFFLEICLDQTRYMESVLALSGLLKRLEQYIRLREAGLIPGPAEATGPLRLEVIPALREAAIAGEVTRGEVFRLIGMSERTGRNTLKQLLTERLLVSDAETGPVRLGFPAHAAVYWFPGLYPAESC